MTKPIFRFGMMSDNHLSYQEPFMEANTRCALQLFREQQVELILDTGDITDSWQPDQLAIFRRLFEETYPDDASRPKILWLPAGHDSAGAADWLAAYKTAADILKSGSLTPRLVLHGYPFVAVPQRMDLTQLEQAVAAAENAARGKPVFAMTHVPASGTVYASIYHSGELRDIMNRHPRVILLTGHSHTPIFDERSIWQGEFTAVNAGSLTYWKGETLGVTTDKKPSSDALIFDVSEDAVVIHRFHAMSGREYRPEAPWRIPLPFVPESAPYRPERQKAAAAVPEFPAGAKPTWSPDGTPFADSILAAPMPVPPDSLYRVRIALDERQTDGAFRRIGLLDFLNAAWPSQHKDTLRCPLPAGMLKEHRDYTAVLMPMNTFNAGGQTIQMDFTTPECRVDALPFNGWTEIASTIRPGDVSENGRFEVTDASESFNIVLPQQTVAAVRTGRRIAAVVTLSYTDAGDGAWLMMQGDKPDYRRQFLQPGAVTQERHVFELSHLAGPRLALHLAPRAHGHFRIDGIEYIAW